MIVLRFSLLVVLFVGAAAGAAVFQSRVHGDQSSAFWNGFTNKFELRNINPPSSGATVKQREAERIAFAQFPEATGILESRLVDFGGVSSSTECLCWMIALTPAAALAPSIGPPRPAGAPTPPATRVFLVFIDARTGAFVMSAAAS